MKGRIILELSGVKKDYYLDETVVPALRGVDLKVIEGDFISIMGPSGAGKSTLLHILGLLDAPTSGKVLIDGVDATTLSEDERADLRGRKIGFVFQFFHLLPSLNALENAALPLLFQEVGESERAERAARSLERVGIAHRAQHLPGQLSGGERQRVAIARAIAPNPQIILCDEPTGNLDLKSGHEIMKLLTDLNRRDGKTVICITHDRDIAEHSRCIYHLVDGRIVRAECVRKVK